MQNRIHSLEDRIFIYKSLGVSPNRRIYCGSIFCKSVKLAEPLDAKPHVWQFDVNAEEWGDTVKAIMGIIRLYLQNLIQPDYSLMEKTKIIHALCYIIFECLLQEWQGADQFIIVMDTWFERLMAE